MKSQRHSTLFQKPWQKLQADIVTAFGYGHTWLPVVTNEDRQPHTLLKRNLLDFIHPVSFTEAAVSDVRNQLEYVVTETTDVDDVCRFLCLGCPRRLDIDTHHLCLSISLFEPAPLVHGFSCQVSYPRSSCVDPRFVVRNVNDQVACCLFK